MMANPLAPGFRKAIGGCKALDFGKKFDYFRLLYLSEAKIMAITGTQALRRLDSYPPERLPESDGKPMAETDAHRKQMFILLDALEEYVRPYPRRYVSGNIFVWKMASTCRLSAHACKAGCSISI
jgi:hypothetical protein